MTTTLTPIDALTRAQDALSAAILERERLTAEHESLQDLTTGLQLDARLDREDPDESEQITGYAARLTVIEARLASLALVLPRLTQERDRLALADERSAFEAGVADLETQVGEYEALVTVLLQQTLPSLAQTVEQLGRLQERIRGRRAHLQATARAHRWEMPYRAFSIDAVSGRVCAAVSEAWRRGVS
jgi:hypothetical protein